MAPTPSGVKHVPPVGAESRPLILRLTGRPEVSLSDIARAAGCTPGFVSMCAHGRRKPTARVRQAAERLLGVAADDLFPKWPAA